MTKRTVLAIALALAACKKDSKKDDGAGKATGTGSATGTGTGTGSAVAAIDAAPAPLVVQIPEAMPRSRHAVAIEPNVKLFATVDGVGGLALGVVPADPKAAWPAPRSVPDLGALVELAKAMQEGVMTGEDAAGLAKRLADAPAPVPTPKAAPPPPPDPDHQPMILDEGKMGKRDPLEEARTARVGALAPSDEVYAGLGNTAPAPAVAPADRTVATGLVYDGADDRLTTIVLADGAGEARALIPVLDALGEIALGVRDADDHLARSAVRYGFRLELAPFDQPTELLVDVAADQVTVRSGPGATHGTAAWTGGEIDAAALVQAYQAAVGDQRRRDVHITIGEAVSVTRLISVTDALIDAGAKELIVRDWTRPELHGPIVTMESPEVVDGMLGDAAIRPAVTGIGAALKQCYVDALAADPTVAGVLDVAVILAPGATVKDVIVRGLDAVSACTKTALGQLAFTYADGGEVAIHFELRYRNLP